MKLYFTKTPAYIKRLFSSQTWSNPQPEKTVYLTFDDGPIPEVTPWVIALLNQHQIKATFFCIGDNIRKHPEIFQQIIAHNHRVGNHTFNHLNGWKTPPNEYIENALECENLLASSSQKLFRPPYGKISIKQSKRLLEMGFKVIMWDVLSADFDQSITPEKCLQNVIKHVENGSIIVFHDSLKARKNLEYALPKTLAYLLEKGYKFKTL